MVNAKHKVWLTELGNTLQRLRKSKKISQEELARASGLSRRTLVSLEQGSGCTMDTLLSVLDGLGESEEMETWLKNFSTRKMLATKRAGSARTNHFDGAVEPDHSPSDPESNPWILER